MANKDFQIIAMFHPTHTAIAVAVATGGSVPPALGVACNNKERERLALQGRPTNHCFRFFTQPLV